MGVYREGRGACVRRAGWGQRSLRVQIVLERGPGRADNGGGGRGNLGEAWGTSLSSNIVAWITTYSVHVNHWSQLYTYM